MSTTFIVKFQANEDQRVALKEFLSNLQPGGIKTGGVRISLHQDQNDPNIFFEIEKWITTKKHQNFVRETIADGAFKPFNSFLKAPFDSIIWKE